MPPTPARARLRLHDLINLASTWEGFAEVQAALRAGRSGTIDGVWGSAAALAVAAMARAATGPLLVVLPHPGDLDFWASDLTTFLGTAPATFPAWEPTRVAALDEIQAQRLRLVKWLRGRTPGPACRWPRRAR